MYMNHFTKVFWGLFASIQHDCQIEEALEAALDWYLAVGRQVSWDPDLDRRWFKNVNYQPHNSEDCDNDLIGFAGSIKLKVK